MELREVHKYMGRVADSKIPVSSYFKMQCQRHFNDLIKADEKGWMYDEKTAKHILGYMTKVARHSKDRWAGKPFGLQMFQATMDALLFGWKKTSEDTGELIRKYSTLYFDIARKNGKTEKVCTTANYMLQYGPHGSEVYFTATKRDQAKITFRVARMQMKWMQKFSTKLAKKIDVRTYDVLYPGKDSIMEYLSSDYDTLDGLSPSMAVIDEYHAHKTSGVLDVMETGQGARWDGPILAVTTTAGFNSDYPCYEFRINSQEVLKGNRTDDSLLPFIFTLDHDDDWNDSSVWYKSNPNMGVSVSTDYLKTQYQKAVNEGPSKQRNFKVKNLNLWVESDDVWIEKQIWLSNAKLTKLTKEYYESLKGKRCYGGLDLSATRDLTSFALVFPVQEGIDRPHILIYHFCPEKRIQEQDRNGFHHAHWVKNGWLMSTQGKTIDYEAVRNTIKSVKKIFKLKKVAFDRWGEQHVIEPLKSTGIEFVMHGQGYADMNQPSKAFERDIYSDEVNIEHFSNPVLSWQIGNVQKATDPAGNIKPIKGKVNRQIDGVVATIMAYGLMKKNETKQSPYRHRGVRTIPGR